ncbi:hypothetical protein LPJ73_002649 [Coemansia sp. RSA 2703]|nr:hypothetical protein LPJ73_002649 [Coemansia sp. RSA 2703]
MATDSVFCTRSADRSVYGKPNIKKDGHCKTPVSSASIHKQCDNTITCAEAQEDHGCVRDVVDSQKNDDTDVISSAATKLHAIEKLLESATQKICHWQETARCEKERAEDQARKVLELEAALQAANDSVSALEIACKWEKSRVVKKAATILKLKSVLKSCRKKKVSLKTDNDSSTNRSNQITQLSIPDDVDSTTATLPASDSVVVVHDQDQATILVSSIDGAAALQSGTDDISRGISQCVEPSLLANPSSEEKPLIGVESCASKGLKRIKPTLEAISGIEMAPQLTVDALADDTTEESEEVLAAGFICKRKVAKARTRKVQNQPTDLQAAHGKLPTSTELDAIGARKCEDYLSKTSANAMAPQPGIDDLASGTALNIGSSTSNNLGYGVALQPGTNNLDSGTNQILLPVPPANLVCAATQQPGSVSLTGVNEHNQEAVFQSFPVSMVAQQSDANTFAHDSSMDIDSTAPINDDNAMELDPLVSANLDDAMDLDSKVIVGMDLDSEVIVGMDLDSEVIVGMTDSEMDAFVQAYFGGEMAP